VARTASEWHTPKTSTMCKRFLGLYNTGTLYAGLYHRITGRYRIQRTDTRSTGDPYTKRVWIISKFWPVRPRSYGQLTLLKTNHMVIAMPGRSRGSMDRQSWKTCRPTGIMSKKFILLKHKLPSYLRWNHQYLKPSQVGRTKLTVIK